MIKLIDSFVEKIHDNEEWEKLYADYECLTDDIDILSVKLFEECEQELIKTINFIDTEINISEMHKNYNTKNIRFNAYTSLVLTMFFKSLDFLIFALPKEDLKHMDEFISYIKQKLSQLDFD